MRTGIEDRLAMVAQSFAEQMLSGCPYDAWKLPFMLARRLRAVVGAEEAVSADPSILRGPVATFCVTLETRGFTLRNFDCSPAAQGDVFGSVSDAWDKMKTRPGEVLVAACQKARTQPIGLRSPLDGYGERFLLVMSLAFHLQSDRPGLCIMLPVDPIGAWLGCDRTAVTPILSLAKKHRVLSVTKEAIFKQGKATEYTLDLAHPALIAPILREPGEDDGDDEGPSPLAPVAPLMASHDVRLRGANAKGIEVGS